MQAKISLTVAAPIERVFKNIASYETLNKSMHGEMKTRLNSTSDDQDMVGTKFHHNIGGILQMEGEIITHQPPLEFAVALNSTNIKGFITYKLVKLEDNKTEINCELELLGGGT